MELSAGQLNRATLGRQLLLEREQLSVLQAVQRVVALQAQEAPSPYVALWNRLRNFDPADLDAAFAEHRVVKGSLIRITLHAVTAQDYPAFHHAMQRSLRASRLNDPRFAVGGVTAAAAEALIPALQQFAAKGRSIAEFEARLTSAHGIETGKPVWWALRTFAPFVHAPSEGAWSFGPRPLYTASRTEPWPGDAVGSMQHLVRRYLQGFGPATLQDMAQFAMVTQVQLREAVPRMTDLVQYLGPGGKTLYDVPEGLLPPADTPAPPRLMAMWDSILLAHADRSRTIPAEHRKIVIRQNGDVLPTLLVDGFVAGVWRPIDGRIEATALQPLSTRAWAGLTAEAEALQAFLADRDPAIYRRFHHWWAKLPAGETRVLAG